MIDHDVISSLIPHAGSMCLIDRVENWDADHILCFTRSHLNPHNPLRRDAMLPALSGVEYASQAMAIHGALAKIVPARPRAGYLASLRNLHARHRRLDVFEEDLKITAERIFADEERAMYEFSLQVRATIILSGRATVVLDIPEIRNL